MIGAAVTAQIVDKPSRVDIVDFQAIWLRGQDVAARNGHLLFDEWTQRMKKGRQLFFSTCSTFGVTKLDIKYILLNKAIASPLKDLFALKASKLLQTMKLDACRKSSFGPNFPFSLLPFLAME